MLRDGIPRRQIVEETSALYGVSAECGRGHGRRRDRLRSDSGCFVRRSEETSGGRK